MRSLILKILPFVLALVLLQVAATTNSKAAPSAWGECDFDGTHYVVCYGDTLFSIGRKFGVYPYYIAQVNGIHNPNYIYAGQVLYIPEGDGWNNGWDDGCGGGFPCLHQPPQRPMPQPSGHRCGHDCNGGGYGYDYSGYYYDGNYPNYNRYSYTCGYNYNCY